MLVIMLKGKIGDSCNAGNCKYLCASAGDGARYGVAPKLEGWLFRTGTKIDSGGT